MSTRNTINIFLVCGLLFSSQVLIIPVAYGGARPAIADAACESLRLRWQTKGVGKDSIREKNFYLFDGADLGCIDLVQTFLNAGALVDARDRAGNTAFMLASRKGHREVLERLLEYDANYSQLNLLGSSALIMAASNNRQKVVERLLELGLNPNQQNIKGVSPLAVAAFNGNGRMVNALLEAGADPGVQDGTGKGPLVYAAGRGFKAIVERLLAEGKLDINQQYGNDLTALMWAAGFSNDVPKKDGIAMVEYLLQKGAKPNLIDNRGRTALHVAVQRGHVRVVELLLQSGAQASVVDRQGKRPVDLTDADDIKRLLD